MEKISVFGSTGFIGSRFCEIYESETYKIEKNDYKNKSNNILYFISTIDNYNIYTDLHVDIFTNLEILMRVLDNIKQNHNPDTVFNFISSWFVYGQTSEAPFYEDKTICNPTGFYSITKHCAEKLLVSFCKTYNIKYRIFRLANVMGEKDQKISKKKNALQYLIKEITLNHDIELYDGGNILRDYIYIDDVCNAIKFCMDNAPTNEIINIGNGEPFVFKDLINKAILYANSKSKIINIEPTNFHNIVQIKNACLNIDKLLSYGYKPSIKNIDLTIKNLVNYYKTNL
jgi:nucleoside-diphosphate-sugar epimerase